MEISFLIIMVCLVAIAGTVLAIIKGESEHKRK